jgi:lipoprotein LprG
VRITLSTEDLSEGVDGLLRAEGVGTHDPAFDGSIVVRYAGIEPTVPVVAVDGTVYAQVPLTIGWSEVDPAEYGAPDPAGLMDPETGFSSLLVETEGLEQGDQVRGGTDNRDILTTYSGTVAGDVVSGIIPSATGEFDATYTVSDDDELRSMELTGDFYGAGSMTYAISFADYGTEPTITAPE